MSHDRYTGRSVLRREDQRLITGTARFVGDMNRDGMLHAHFVRSPIAHGTLAGIDVTEAAAAPGVSAIFDAGDLGVRDLPAARVDVVMDRPSLVHDRIRYVGEALAVVVADSPFAAADAAELVWPEIDPLPAVVTSEEALAGLALLHADTATNVVRRTGVQTSPLPWGYPVEVDVTVINQRVIAAPIEPLAALAEPFGEGVRLWATHQTPHRLRDDLVEVLGFPVEVTVPDVGGGFGLKGRFYPEFAVVAALARRLERPVRWIQTRRESMTGGAHGRDMSHRVRLAGDADGRVRRCHITITGAVGAYPHTGAQVLDFSALVAQELYDFEELTVDTTAVVTNQAPTAPYRGAGRPEAALAMERAMEAFARTAGLDPIAFRRANLLTPATFPYRTHTGALYDSGDYRAAFDEAVEMLDITAVRTEQARRVRLGLDPIGVGLGVFVERAGGPPTSGEYASTEIGQDGRVVVRTGSTSNGQGHETVWAQVAADVFDLDIDQVDVIGGDTVRVKSGFGSTASRSAQIGASGVLRTSLWILQRAREIAAQELEVAEQDLVLDRGRLSVAGSPEAGLSLAQIAGLEAEAGGHLSFEEFYSPGAQTFPYGVHGAVVEVSVDTGDVTVTDLVAVDDCGRVLNPMIVDGQIHGSLAQGLGQALMESIRYDDQGQLLTSTLMDYTMPRADDMPQIRLGRVISPAPSNPLGVKGSGESGCIGAPPAIVNAVLDALAPWGITHLDMPLRPMTIWSALQNAAE